MEVPELMCPASPARDQPAPAQGAPGVPGRQASPHLTLGPVILPREQGLAPALFLKALPISLCHTVPPGVLRPHAPLVTGSLDRGGVPFILSPLLQPEGPGPTQVGKPAAPTLTVNIVGALPVLSPGLGPALGSPGKVRSAGKHLCPHCGRDCLKPSVLEKHIRSHTGERPFPCATCGIAFKTQSNLYKHRRTQTHRSNSRLSAGGDGAGGLPAEGDAAAGLASHGPPSPGSPAPSTSRAPSAGDLGLSAEAGPPPADGAAPAAAGPGLPLAGAQPPRRPLEQRSPGGRPGPPPQPATPSEKPWAARAAEGRLRQCESTDSGYLSRSDSAEPPPAPASPLHGPSEHGAGSEGEAAPGPRLELEKQRLEERISRLISHNQAVVNDPQLDNVRPRKTVLSKQGSIDLPMPYTYKDSFHFDLRALEPGRRRPAALCPARSTLLDRARPRFCHSVPTQLSSTVGCIPVTRSNSLPVVEGTRTWQGPPEPWDAWPRRQKPPSPRPMPTRLSNVPSGHPRALVRQAAVEDLPCLPSGDTPAPAEDAAGGRPAAGERAAGKGRGAGKKGSQRKLKMFSQEKWQMYGNETFQRIYQKMNTSHHGAKKVREVRAGSGTELDPALQEEAAGGKAAVPSQDGGSPDCGDISVGAKLGPWGSSPAPEQRETVARAGGGNQPRAHSATSPATLSCTESTCLDSLELEGQLLPAPDSLKGSDLRAPRMVSTDPKPESSTCTGGGAKEACERAHTVPRWPSSCSGEPQPAEGKLPSERKKLKVQELSSQEQSEPPGTVGETPEGPTQATSLPSQNQDSEPRTTPGGLHTSAHCTVSGRARQPGEPPEATCACSVASSAALRQVGLRDQEPLPCPAAAAPGCPSQLAAQLQAPGVLTAVADTTFPPKYLLRSPQGVTHSSPPPPSVAQGPGHSQDAVCRTGWPEDQASFTASGLQTFLPPGPASGLAPGDTEGCKEDPSWSKQGVGEDLDTSTSAPRKSHGLASGAPREMASFPPTSTHASQRSETHGTQHCGTGSTLERIRLSGSVLNPCAPDRKLGVPPENAPEGPPSGPLTRLSSCCSCQYSSFLTTLTPSSWSEPTTCVHSQSPGSCGTQGPFPSLTAEPRLTWCCLSRSLPLPREQEKAASVRLALHFPRGSPPDEGLDAWLVSRTVSGGCTRTSPGEGQAQTSKLSYPIAPRMVSWDQVSEPEWKKGVPCRKVKMPRGSSKQRKLSINSKRHKGTFLPSRVQLRGSRPRKPLWVLRRDCHPPPLEGAGPRRTRLASSETAGLRLQGEPSGDPSKSSVCCGNREKEDGGRQASPSFPLSTSSRTVSAAAKDMVKDISPSASEHGDCRPQNSAVRPGLSLQSDSRVTMVDDGLLPQGEGLDVGSLDTQLPPSQEQVSPDRTPCIFPDVREPPAFECKGASLHHDDTVSAAALCASGERAGQTTEFPEAPSKTIKKRSLEGMRKQTRVELSDSSSDDEDRLVIEI
ncbi:zinc finger protein 831 isoform X2 [Manis pentadactyla]|uniref:zinc finger protein 831 isoform X2 n=1 Tax=Manis pentadactyla TaxID=143292 RepID=UPI00255CACE6|nr:zinc finger protein 831 isoform X2 [Manis pentadactyla]